MTREEAKSCIGTIEMLQRLAYNIHGVMDVIDADNCKKIIKALEQEPSVQPKQDWIPITERLPEENGKYFVMYRERKEKIIRVGIDYFMEIDGELGFWCFDVIKWMPIPEYKENKE